jgi:hypothetical protein
MATPTATLHDLFPGDWGAEQPKTLVDLVQADYDDLGETARTLRKLAMELVHSFERAPILTARTAHELLEKHHLPVRKGRWIAVALDGRRERIYTAREGAGMRLLHAVSMKFPKAETLLEKAPIPADGRYLLIYGGGPEALTEENLNAFERLTKRCHVSDVILWEQQEHSATFWSVKTGHGRRGSEIIGFPDHGTTGRWQEQC